MKKHLLRIIFLFSAFFVLYTGIRAQCTYTSQYGSATINNTNPGTSVTITTCQWGGEYAPITFNVTGAFTFSSSVASDYFTLTNASNSVIASGNNPLNVVIPTTGTYYLHTAASGPTLCATQAVCRTTSVLVPLPPCSGVPITGTTTAIPAVICPNTSATLSLPGGSTGSGLMYQWYSSTSGPFGPFGLVAGAGASVVTTPTIASVTTWYQAVVACTISGQTNTSSPVSVGIAGTTTNSIPYSESFENLIVDNQLPNCSWKASNLPTTCQTYIAANSNNRVPRTGLKYASFYYLPLGSSYFYSNGLLLKAGVTYSASVWYTTEYYTYTNWTNLSILLGPNQSTLGLQTIASTNGTAASPNYKSLSNTFTVASTGIYYLAIKASSNGQCCAQYLSFDDLEVIAPCSLNTPMASLNASNDSICTGQSVSLFASGADTYTWSTGATGASITLSPSNNTVVSVIATNSASSCSATLSQAITVFPVYPVSIFASTLSVCPGSSVYLSAYGASNFTWSQGGNTSTSAVSPTISTSYTVIGSNNFGCTSQAVASVSVLPVPSVSASSNKTLVCAGESVTLNAVGAQSYKWIFDNNLYFGQPLVFQPLTSGICTVIGIAANGCTNTAQININLTECTALAELQQNTSGIRVFPNPGSGHYTLQFLNSEIRTLEISDAFGKLICTAVTEKQETVIELGQDVAKGLYYLSVKTETGCVRLKIVKN